MGDKGGAGGQPTREGRGVDLTDNANGTRGPKETTAGGTGRTGLGNDLAKQTEEKGRRHSPERDDLDPGDGASPGPAPVPGVDPGPD